MIFYTVIIGIIDMSVSRMHIGQDLKKTEGPFQVLCVCWRESNFMEVRNIVLSLDLVQNMSIEQ